MSVKGGRHIELGFLELFSKTDSRRVCDSSSASPQSEMVCVGSVATITNYPKCIDGKHTEVLSHGSMELESRWAQLVSLLWLSQDRLRYR